ncbi:hypothetical protein TNIN_469851 [Trichonephila inaurata madagascariensis]|uniref:Uncharacterized protein n=1 Tax=Trichonephila inaurata madagascariensis TaxID=2747483 RepID=A0A8X6X8Z0_9ARAC|nr:hypothetical protein TNIN_469851 [Trichonephila inaurata madagascariensis]
MSTSRTDAASSIKVGYLFTNEPLSFEANVATAHLDKCTTCVECEDLCDVLEEIFLTLNDPDVENTPERLRLINLIQWTVLKCSSKSIRLQNQEFKDYIKEIEREIESYPHCVRTRFTAEMEESQTPDFFASERHSIQKTGMLTLLTSLGNGTRSVPPSHIESR